MILIGVVFTGDPRMQQVFRSNYGKAVRRGGGVPVFLPWKPKHAAFWAKHLDGFLFTGGGDPDPKYYGESMRPECGTPNPARDEFELALLKAVMDTGKPILGICRGIQVLNAFLGGELYQDIKPLEHVPHNDHWAKIHTVTVRRGTLLAEILKQDTVLVNSQHHQAASRVAPGLEIAALSEDGFIEALEKPDATFCLGVQWHPEWLSEADPRQQALFDAFVKACH